MKKGIRNKKVKDSGVREDRDNRCKVAESKIERQRRLNKQKEYENEKRFAESEIERQRRLNKQKEYDHEKRSAESEIDKQMRQTKDKITKHKRYKLGQDFMGPLQVWPMVKSTRRYIGTALRGALYSLSYLLFVVCM